MAALTTAPRPLAGLAALRLREEAGASQHIDMSMLEATLASDDYMHYLIGERPEPYPTRGTVWLAPGGPLLLAAREKHLWTTIGVGPWARSREVHREGRALPAWFAGFRSRSLLLDELETFGLASADITTPVDVLSWSALTGRRTTTLPDGPGTRPILRMPHHFSAANAEPLRGAARRSAHTKEVLGEWLGMTPSAVDALHNQGVLIT